LLHTAIGAQPGNWRTINHLGAFLFSMGRYREAADVYRQIVFLDPENLQARSNLGSALTLAGEFERGRQVLEESLEIQPLQRTYSNLGVIYYLSGRVRKIRCHVPPGGGTNAGAGNAVAEPGGFTALRGAG
jgi:tetratricopeptide (TPR) repeat protein